MSHAPWRPCFLTDQISLSSFCRWSPKNHSCEVCLKLAKWFSRSCHLKQIVDDARRTLTDPNSSFLCELKRELALRPAPGVHQIKQGLYLMLGEHLCYLCLVFVMLSHLFIAALRSPEGKGLTSWLLFVMFIMILLLSHLVFWDSCGT